jgi:hypothetical protein
MRIVLHWGAPSGTAQECPLLEDERKTFAHSQVFSV